MQTSNNYNNKKRIPIYCGDYIIIAATVLLAFLIYCLFLLPAKDSPALVRVVADNSEIAKYSTEDNGTYTVSSNGYTLEILIVDGKVSVTHSDCPNKYCVASGEITQSGQVIVCAPAHIKIELCEGVNVSDETDFTVG